MDHEISVIDFANIKKQILQNVDNSKKGSIDEPIIPLLEKLNNHNSLVSTSSCSGRIIIISQKPTEVKKKNCHWVFSSHDYITEEYFLKSIKEAKGPLTLKFEPFILHAQCRTLDLAKTLLDLALASGFRNSGLVIGKHGKIIVAVRSTNNLEVPLADDEDLLVSDRDHSLIVHVTEMTSNKPSVFVSRSDFPEAGISLLKERCDVEIWPIENGPISRENFLTKVKGKDALFIYSSNQIDEEVVAAAGSNLKVISTMSVGLDHINLNYLKSTSIRLGYTPNVLTEAVAELTIALLLTTSRRIIEANKTISRSEWKWTPTWMCGTGLSGSTVGLVGFGRIGQSIAKKLLSFDVSEILYSGPRQKKEAESFGAIYVSFDDLLKRSDYVIATCPLTKETAGLFSLEKFRLMKPTAIFINSARGGIVDQDALVYALENKLIKAAGLDVMTPEPLPPDHPLVKLDNCVLTPHIGSATIETRDNMCILAVNNILAVFDGKDMPAEYKF